MRTVFKRYEITKALPIEYGAVIAINALSGLVFYNESQYMKTWQIAIMLTGILVILIGIMIGLRQNESPNVKKAQPKQVLEKVNPDKEDNCKIEHECQESYDHEVITPFINPRSDRSSTSNTSISTQELLEIISMQFGVDIPKEKVQDL